ncbi:MAG: response regulator [Xanthomonadales bacterium]|nr:response regulator [Xanthomonadales bacterium]
MSEAGGAQSTLIELGKGALADCLELANTAWDGARAARVQGELERLADFAANLDQEAIGGAALDLYAYLGVFAEGTLRPSPLQQDELLQLTQGLREALAPIAPEVTPGEQTRVLALLPQADALDSWQATLSQEGMDLHRVIDGDELARALGQQLPSALLIDAELVSATCELLDGLAEQRPDAVRIPLLAIGPADQPRIRLKALLDGADDYLAEPQENDLLRQLRVLLDAQDDQPFRVLVVDDDRQMGQYCDRILRRAGMQVRVVHAADRVLPSVREFHPDLLLIDLYLPGQDGMSLTAELRESSDSLVLPIVFLSGEHSEEARFRAISAGGDDFLTKPIRPRHLVAAVRSRIKRVRGLSRRLARRATASGSAHGLIRRGEFLQALGSAAGDHRRVLAAMAVDQAEDLDQRLGMAAKYELEQAIAQRVLRQLQSTESLCLWREFGFGALLDAATNSDVLQRAEATLRVVSETPFRLQGQEQGLSISIGLAIEPVQRSDSDAWINAAFAALGAAQRLGGNRCEGLLVDDDQNLSPERLMWIRELVRLGASGSGLSAEFQPLMPLRGQRSGHYALLLKLRDKRRPLEGIFRHEYLQVARELQLEGKLERMALFRALEALDEQRSRQRSASVLVALDLMSFDREQLSWLERELQRRDYKGQLLVIEFEADVLLTRPPLIGLVKRLRQLAVRVIVAEPGLARLPELLKLPVDGVRLPVGAILSADAQVVSPLLADWHALGRSVQVHQVDELTQMSRLWNLGVDYLQGEAVAAPGPRLDFDFGDGG